MSNECIKGFESRLDIMDERAPGQPRQEVILSRLQFMIYKKMNELINHNLQPYGINDTIWTALIMLYSSPDHFIFPSDLSHIIVSSRTNITRLADEMVEKGWMKRQGCESDRRKIILTLTKAGVALVEAIIPKQWAIYGEIWQDFSSAEKDRMEAMQRKLVASLSHAQAQNSACAEPALPDGNWECDA
ncbi:MAG: MarR family transcriptional regulator [Burkholderiales bacterium]